MIPSCVRWNLLVTVTLRRIQKKKNFYVLRVYQRIPYIIYIFKNLVGEQKVINHI